MLILSFVILDIVNSVSYRWFLVVRNGTLLWGGVDRHATLSLEMQSAMPVHKEAYLNLKKEAAKTPMGWNCEEGQQRHQKASIPKGSFT